jgi:hypothetical protein
MKIKETMALTSTGRLHQNVGTYMDSPMVTRRQPIDDESFELAYDTTISNVCLHPIPAISNQGHFYDYHTQQKIQQQFLAECYLLQDTWFSDPNCFTTFTDSIILDTWDMNEMYFNEIKDPRILKARATSSKLNEDNPSFNTATCGPFQVQFWKAMYNKLVTLVQEFDCWHYVPQTPTTKVLPSTWAFKIKRYPNGHVKKFKAQFCAQGNRQTEGVNYFETWAPVIQWSTVRIVMILAIKLNLISIQ